MVLQHYLGVGRSQPAHWRRQGEDYLQQEGQEKGTVIEGFTEAERWGETTFETYYCELNQYKYTITINH